MRLFEFDSPRDMIATNCSKIYNARNALTLYRGLTEDDEKATKSQFVATIRKDRMPRDSNEFQQEIFDSYMELEGWEFRKANTLSVSNHKHIATAYGGHIFEIYPFDDAVYLYSPEIRDFYDFPQWAEDKLSILELKGFTLSIPEFIQKYLDEIRERFQFIRTDNPKDLIHAAGEIVVFGTKYVATKYDGN